MVAGKMILFTLLLFFLAADPTAAQEKKLETFNVAYTSATPTRAPLWIAKEIESRGRQTRNLRRGPSAPRTFRAGALTASHSDLPG